MSGKGGAYDDVPELDSDLDMIVELLEGQFASTIGFSGKAMAVSSHSDTGILEAVAQLTKLAIKCDYENVECTENETPDSNENRESMADQMPEVRRRASSKTSKNIKLHSPTKSNEGCCSGGCAC